MIAARVPATSANLGPGFDCFGMALRLFNDVELVADGPFGVEVIGEGAEVLPRDVIEIQRINRFLPPAGVLVAAVEEHDRPALRAA